MNNKNTKPLPSGSNWQDVDNFLHTWGFLPHDHDSLNKLPNDDKNQIIGLLLDYTWRKDQDYQELAIKKVQEVLEEFGAAEYFQDKI